MSCGTATPAKDQNKHLLNRIFKLNRQEKLVGEEGYLCVLGVVTEAEGPVCPRRQQKAVTNLGCKHKPEPGDCSMGQMGL